MGNIIQASDITVEQIQSTNGVIIYDENSTWGGNPIEWEVIGKDQDGQGTITIQTKKALTGFAWDTINTEGNNLRLQFGANRIDSLLHQWLNSDDINWYSPQHSNQEPSADTVYQYTFYGMSDADDVGFMRRLSSYFKSILVNTTKKVTPNISGDPSSFVGKLFLLSVAEVGIPSLSRYEPEEGAFSYQRYIDSTNDSRKKIDTNGTERQWRLRSPYNDEYGTNNHNVHTDGVIYNRFAYSAESYVAPACAITSSVYLEEDENGKYKLLAPTHDDEYLDYDGLVEIANRTERKFRFSEMPTPSADWLGKSIQYIGTTTVTEPIYTHNHFYECKTKIVEGQTVYYWDSTEPTIKPITNAQIDAWWNGGN